MMLTDPDLNCKKNTGQNRDRQTDMQINKPISDNKTNSTLFQ